jgi:hypothetical protein
VDAPSTRIQRALADPCNNFSGSGNPLPWLKYSRHAVRAAADRKHALVPALARRIADDEAVAIFIHHLMGGGQTLEQRPSHGADEPLSAAAARARTWRSAYATRLPPIVAPRRRLGAQL